MIIAMQLVVISAYRQTINIRRTLIGSKLLITQL